MPRSREDFTYLDISRPVDGLEGFIGKAAYYGQQAFGQTATGSITELGITDEDDMPRSPLDDDLGPDILTIRPVGIPRLKVYDADDLQLTLLHRRVPTELSFGSRFRNAAHQLTRKESPVNHPLIVEGKPREKYRTSPLYKQLFQAGLEFDIPSQDAVPITFTAIEVSPDPDLSEKGVELALVPSPAEAATHMLVRQSEICFRALAALSKKSAYPTNGRLPLNVPFARLPAQFQEHEVARFMEYMADLLPVRGIVGAIVPYPTQHN